MKSLSLPLNALLLLATFACSPKENTSSETIATAATAVFADFTQTKLPYTADTLLMNRTDKPLDVEKIAEVFRNATEAVEYEGGAYYFKQFLHLDSLYKANANPTFDIGAMVKMKAYALHQWTVSKQAIAITVLIDFQSYEADPYSAGKIVTLLTCTPEGKPINSLVIAEYIGGGDPPYFSTTLVTATVTPNQEIQMQETVNSGEYLDNDMIDTTVRSKEKVFRIESNGKISKVSEKEQPEQRFQKPTQR